MQRMHLNEGSFGSTCELWSWRGLASLPSLPMGELMRRRCDSVEA